MRRAELLKTCLELEGTKAHKEKAVEFTKIRKMKSNELLKKVSELGKEAKLVEENKCLKCLNEQRIQRKIDEKTHNQRVLDNMVRDLVCECYTHETLIFDGESSFCESCGSAQNPSLSHDKYQN